MTRLGIIICGILVAVIIVLQRQVSILSEQITHPLKLDTTIVEKNIVIIQNYPERIDTVRIEKIKSDTIYLHKYFPIQVGKITSKLQSM